MQVGASGGGFLCHIGAHRTSDWVSRMAKNRKKRLEGRCNKILIGGTLLRRGNAIWLIDHIAIDGLTMINKDNAHQRD
jgi:hypothetical protein